MKRYMCVWLPGWPIQRLRRARPEHDDVSPTRQRGKNVSTAEHGAPSLARRAHGAMVLHAPARGRIVVAACSTSAQALGIAVGMPLGEAKALAVGAEVYFETHDPHADREALHALARWSQRFSPLVAVEEADAPSCLLLDVTGCAAVFGGETKLRAKTIADFRRLGYRVEVTLADTIGAAWALAHYGMVDGHDRPSPPVLGGRGDGGEGGQCPTAVHGNVVSDDGSIEDGDARRFELSANTTPPQAETTSPHTDIGYCPPSPPSPLPPSTGGEGRSRPRASHSPLSTLHSPLLPPLPVAALRLSTSTLELLRQFDIRRIEQLLALSRKDWKRLDPEVVRRLDQALGKVPELLTYERTEEPIEYSWPFEPPIHQRGILERVLEQHLDQILARLHPRQLGVRRLVCTLTTETEPVHVAIDLLQPSDSAKHLMELVRLHFERVRLPSAVTAAALRADVIVPLEFEQSQLFESEAGGERWRQLPTLIERLSQRLGETAVLRPRLWPDAQPEHACRYDPWLREKASPRPRPAPSFGKRVLVRPPCLTRPTPITVTTPYPGGPPERFQWQGQCHVIERSWGPERIETGWWRHHDVCRDYYLVETTAGRRFWLYRGSAQRWCLHGTYG